MQKNIFFSLIVIFLFAGCSRRIVVQDQGNKNIRSVIQDSGLATDHYMGFALFDPEENKMIYQINSDKYFVPASNTKIFTLYTALNYLPDSLHALEIATSNDQIVIRGTGHPGFLHPDFEVFQQPLVNIIDTSKEILLSDFHYRDKRFGNGWAWDDYRYGYQVEKSALPIFGNRVWLDKQNETITIKPEWYASFFTAHNDDDNLPDVYRDEFANAFSFNKENLPDTVSRTMPFSYSSYEVSQILSKVFGHKVKPTFKDEKLSYHKAYDMPLDTIYRQLMRHSDNFIAEQLLLASGHMKLNYMQTDSIIRFAKKALFEEAPDPLLWYDGSGLSRYNMFTPRTVIWVLNQIYKKQSRSFVQDVFPAGGVSGTIKNWYGADEPYVYAKTGTLRNKHCLSGYLIAKSGKVFIFSFMHNNYAGSSSKAKKKMQGILEYIRDSF